MNEIYSLKTLMHPVMKAGFYPNCLNALRRVKLEKIELKRPYIGDQLDTALMIWRPEKPVFITAPTGTGKTTFVVDKVCKKAIAKKENVLILTNRSPLNIAYKKEVCILLNLEDFYTDNGLAKAVKFENIYILNYQAFQSFMRDNSHVNFRYVISDEIHYFMQDSCFSDCTEYVLTSIPRLFCGAIRIYLSATITEILPYILSTEIPGIFVDEYGCIFKKKPYDINLYDAGACLPFIYEMTQDYSRVNLWFYRDTEELLSTLKAQEGKILFFGNSVNECKKVTKIIGDTKVLYAEAISEDKEVIKELLDKKMFSEKCLATTSVFSNGNSIKDSAVTSVVIEVLDPTEILQMAGRRRINYSSKNDGFDLYLKIPDLGNLKKMFRNYDHNLSCIERALENPRLVKAAFKNTYDPDAELIRSITHYNYALDRFEVNSLARVKFFNLRNQINFIHALIEEKGVEAYCGYIAKMFEKTFESEMLKFRLEDKKERMLNFLRTAGFPFPCTQLKEFSEKFRDTRIKIFGKDSTDNLSKTRAAPGVRAINNWLKRTGIPLQIEIEKEILFLRPGALEEAYKYEEIET